MAAPPPPTHTHTHQISFLTSCDFSVLLGGCEGCVGGGCEEGGVVLSPRLVVGGEGCLVRDCLIVSTASPNYKRGERKGT